MPCVFLNILREGRPEGAVQGAPGCVDSGDLSDTCLSEHRRVLAGPRSLIKSQLLARRTRCSALGLCGESLLQLNMPSTSNDSRVRWEEQNDGEKSLWFACVFHTFSVHVCLVLTKEQRQLQLVVKSTLWLDGNNSQRKLHFCSDQKISVLQHFFSRNYNSPCKEGKLITKSTTSCW